MIEVVFAFIYCAVVTYACFRVGMDIRVSQAKTKKQKFLRIALLILMVFGLLVSAVLFAEVILYVLAPGIGFDIF